MPNIKFAAKTDVGSKRKMNEDSVCAAAEIGLFVVADGMGGHSAGEVASQMAIEVVKNGLTEKRKKGELDSSAFVSVIKLANTAIYEMGHKATGKKGMGTTITGILVNKDRYTVANVGDSRVYRIRGNSMEQLTMDHSMINIQLSMNIITKEEAKNSPYKNVITRALGAEENVDADARDEDIVKGDKIVICSDGLWGLVEDGDILETVQRAGDNLEKGCDELISLANFNGGDDNISVILVRFE